jgi:T-complex protein 1 subunit theta
MQMGAGMPGITGLLKDGYKHYSGMEEAVLKNIEACKQMSGITRTSFGPNGMNKLVINHLNKVFITSATSTILKELEVEHPAAKLIVMATERQSDEAGDACNFVVTLAGQLLDEAAGLLRMGVHTTEVLSGYMKAYEKAKEILDTLVVGEVSDARKPEELIKAVAPAIASKQYGFEDVLAPLVAKATSSVLSAKAKRPKLNADNVRVAKLLGGSMYDSQVVKGHVVMRPAEGTVRRVSKAKVAVFGCAVEAAATETKGTIVIRTAEELKNYNKGEEARMEAAIKAVAETGAKVVVSGGSISEMALHFIEKYDMMALKIVSKWELRRICRAIGATATVRLGAPTPEELGYADEVAVEEMSGRAVTVFRQGEEESSGIATIVLRGPTVNLLDDLERAVDNGVGVTKTMCKDGRLLAGAGATEMELALQLSAFGDATTGMDQYAIHKFAESLEVFARTLAENAGKRGSDVLSAVYAAHRDGNKAAGVDIEPGEGLVVDAVAAGVFDSYYAKYEALRLTMEVVSTVLRVDQIIMSKQAGGPKTDRPVNPGRM